MSSSDSTQTGKADYIAQIHADECLSKLKKSKLLAGLNFEELPVSQLQRLKDGTEFVKLGKGESLVLKATDLYEIISGYVKVYDPSKGNREPKRAFGDREPRPLLAWRIPGDLLGDFQFLVSPESEYQNDDMVATDECQLLKFNAPTLRELAHTHNIILWNMARQLALKAINSRTRAHIICHKNTAVRVALLFIELIKERKLEGRILNGSYKVQDFSGFLGNRYDSISVACRYLIDVAGCIKHLDGNKKSFRYEILDEEKLHQIVANPPSASEMRKSLATNSPDEEEF